MTVANLLCASAVAVALDSNAASLLAVRPFAVEVFGHERRRSSLPVAWRLLLEHLYLREHHRRAAARRPQHVALQHKSTHALREHRRFAAAKNPQHVELQRNNMQNIACYRSVTFTTWGICCD